QVPVEMAGEESDDGLCSDRERRGVPTDHWDSCEHGPEPLERGIALIERKAGSRNDAGEHSGTGTDVEERHRVEPAEPLLDLFEFGPQRFQVDIDAQASEVCVCTFDTARVVWS